MLATRDPRGRLYGGAVRACGRAGERPERQLHGLGPAAPTRARPPPTR